VAEQAEKTAAEAAAQRARADELTTELSARTEELATRTAERDAARTALQDLHGQRATAERILTEQNTELAAELETLQAQLRECEARNQNLTAEHHTRDAELRTRIGETQAELAGTRGQLDAAHAQIAHAAARHDQIAGVLSRVRRRALDAAAEPSTPLRDDLLAILLADGD
jgi:DNA repair exonuclease SbcCD ATPase subunit